jgi:hypothetical protein
MCRIAAGLADATVAASPISPTRGSAESTVFAEIVCLAIGSIPAGRGKKSKILADKKHEMD